MENYLSREADKENNPNAQKIGELLTKNWISAKLKIFRSDFCKAIHKEKRSGGRRVVLTFFYLCEQLWGCSPAFTAIENSIDSQGAHLEESFSPSTSDDTNCNNTLIDMPMLTHQENEKTDKENNPEELPLTANDITTNEGERANEFLKIKREKTLSIRLCNDEQMLNIAKEDMFLKRKLSSQFEKSDEEFNSSISKMGKTMESIGNAM